MDVQLATPQERWFEIDNTIGRWGAYSGLATIPVVTNETAHSGGHCLKTTVLGAYGGFVLTVTAPPGTVSYTISYWVKGPAGATAYLIGPANAVEQPLLTGDWQVIVQGGAVAPGTMQFYILNATGTDSLYVDDVSVVASGPNIVSSGGSSELSALWQRLSNGQSGGLVSLYRGAPAVYKSDPVPGDTARPFLVVQGPHTQQPFDSKNTLGTDSRYTVDAVTDPDGRISTLDALVDAIKRDLHRKPVSWGGAHPSQGMIAEIVAVSTVPTDGTLYSRQVTVRLVSQES